MSRATAVQSEVPVDARAHSGTAYLDGVRGWASLMVLIGHATGGFLRVEDSPWQHKLLHVLGNGSLAVHIFFVLSGFVLSIRFIETANRKALLGLAIRRYPRLTIPIFIVSFLGLLLMMSGLLFNSQAAARLGSENNLGILLQFDPSVLGFLQFSLFDVYLNYGLERSYNTNLWTMPIELMGSMVVFAVLLVPMRPLVRRIVVVVLAVIGLFVSPAYADFFIGVALAELWATRILSRLEPPWRIAVPAGCIAAAVAMKGAAAMDVVPPTGAVESLLAGLLVIVPMSWGLGRRFFESRPSLWLGKLSFPLYLIHPLIIFCPSSWLALQLIDAPLPELLVRDIVLATTFALSLLAAHLFYPVETWAIAGSRRVSEAVFYLWGRHAPPDRAKATQAPSAEAP